MRDKMLEGHPSDQAAECSTLKHDRGGIVDVEFIVQYLVLGHAHRHAELTGNIGNMALLKLAAGLGLIPAELAEAVRNGPIASTGARSTALPARQALRACRTGDRGRTRASGGQAMG